MRRKSKERDTGRAQKLEFIGNYEHDSVVIGNHGNSSVEIDGVFNISGIIYSPKYTVTMTISGKGTATFRGVCAKIIINNISDDCTLDLRDLSCKEIAVYAAKGKAKIITGKVRAVVEASLKDDAILYTTENPLIFNALMAGNAKITSYDEPVEKKMSV
ncbi:hypothetical protein [Chryseosolibacter indicus]|uniref:Auto-transporter adhesin head GIN domain-containing protein n=1 Tax=Chryseosolibacter indicus TaxID=2782351 RepID=A0ABS5VNA1_9BACT|nr:hypothetical protein [Chryseosolibacter indicus]MBT1702918.1 hypothetical protein [Chryseosolibacter indicus]